MTNVIALPGSAASITLPGVLTADRDQIARFVDALFRHADEETIAALRAFPDGGASGPPVGRRDVEITDGGLDRLALIATGMATDAARHPLPAVFCPPVATFTKGGKADRASLANGLAISVEIDARPLEARRRLEGLIGPATVVVRSGGRAVDPETGEVEDRLHCHWRLTEPTRVDADHDALTEARTLAARLVGGDPTSASPVHPLRWPGSWHRKAAPVMAEIIGGDPDAEIDLGDALDLLREAVGAAAMMPASERRPAPSTTLTVGGGRTAAIEDVRSWLEAIPNDADWAEWNRVGMAIWAATKGSDAGFDAFGMWSARSAKYDAGTTRARWDAFGRSPPSKIGAGTLAYLAAQNSPPGRVTEPPQKGMDAWGDSGVTGEATVPDPRQRAAQAPRRLVRLDRHIEAMTFPDQLVDGVVARGYLYALTGQTGHGKTTVATSLALAVASGRPWAGRDVERGRVLILAGENPVDAGLRLAAAVQRLGIDDDTVHRVAVMCDTFDIAAEADSIAAEVSEFGPLSLVLVDTAAAFFLGDDENDNPGMRRYASILRDLTGLPGNPTVIVLCHPTKSAERGNLKPRGGGAFLGEIDGNLTCWKDGALVSVGHEKLRGPSFDPFRFELEPVEILSKRDSRGRHPMSVVAVHVGEERAERLEAVAQADDLTILRVIRDNPGASVRDLARAAGWVNENREPLKSKVERILKGLAKVRRVEQEPVTKKWSLTPAGQRLVREAPE